jgi:hypothetical protein
MLIVFRHLGLMEDDSAPEVKAGKIRDQAAFDAGKRNMAELFPKIAAQLCDTVRTTRSNPLGREAVTARDLAFGVLRYVQLGKCLRETESQLRLDHAAGYLQRPYSYALLSQYLNDPRTGPELDRLLLTTFITTSHFSNSCGPDGTGIQLRNYYEYGALRTQEKRRRGFIMAVPLIIYETNIIPAVALYERQPWGTGPREDDGLRGEAPYLLALLERVRPYFPSLEIVRHDLGFFKRMHYLWGECYGIRFVSGFKENFRTTPAAFGPEVRASARAYDAWHTNEDASWKEYHKRSQQEGVMNGLKVQFGGGVHARSELAKGNEIRLKWLAYNIHQIIYLMESRNWTPDFQAAASRLGDQDLTPLEELAAKYLGRHADAVILKEAEAAKGSTR